MRFLLEIRPIDLFLRRLFSRAERATERGQNRRDFAPRTALEQGQPLWRTAIEAPWLLVKGVRLPLAGN
jgi:hypothetical protein